MLHHLYIGISCPIDNGKRNTCTTNGSSYYKFGQMVEVESDLEVAGCLLQLQATQVEKSTSKIEEINGNE